MFDDKLSKDLLLSARANNNLAIIRILQDILRVNEEYPRGREYGNKKGWNIEN